MNPTTPTMSGTRDRKQAGNRSETVESSPETPGPSSDQLRQAAAALRGIIETDWDTQRLAKKMLLALCVLVEENPERSDAGWIAEEIARAMTRFGVNGWAVNEEEARKRANEHWKTLVPLWESKREGVEQRLQARGIGLKAKIDHDQGGEDPTARRYFLQFTFAETDDRDRYPTPSGAILNVEPIRYFTEEISSNRLLRRLSRYGFFLGGLGGHILVVSLASLGFVLIVSAALFWIVMSAAQSSVMFLKGGLTVATIVSLGWVLLRWWVRLVEDRIAKAPLILQPLSKYDDYLLELRPRDGTDTDAIFLVRYIGDCPICGENGRGRVRIESGRIEFHGRRLTGRCRNAPNAHVFSFDHVTRWGRFLR